MNIRKPQTIKQRAQLLLAEAQHHRRIILIYCGILLASCACVTADTSGAGP